MNLPLLKLIDELLARMKTGPGQQFGLEYWNRDESTITVEDHLKHVARDEVAREGSNILSEAFFEVSRFAGHERYLRGPGDKRQYDYSIWDVHMVSLLWDQAGRKRFTDEEVKKAGGDRKTINLAQAFLRYQKL